MKDPRNLLNINPELVKRILVNAIRQTGEAITGNAHNRWVVNLSGGLDSSLVSLSGGGSGGAGECARAAAALPHLRAGQPRGCHAGGGGAGHRLPRL